MGVPCKHDNDSIWEYKEIMDLETKNWFKDWICEDQMICEGLDNE